MKKFICISSLLLLFAATQAGAQVYGTGLGLRLSPFWGVTVKHFYNNDNAIEGILHSRWNAFKLTGLWERHTEVFNEPGFQFYYGAGGHMGAALGRYYDDRFYNGGRLIFGIDGILGLGYTLPPTAAPLNFSVDWKPAVDFAPFASFWGSEIGVSVRYTFR